LICHLLGGEWHGLESDKVRVWTLLWKDKPLLQMQAIPASKHKMVSSSLMGWKRQMRGKEMDATIVIHVLILWKVKILNTAQLQCVCMLLLHISVSWWLNSLIIFFLRHLKRTITHCSIHHWSSKYKINVGLKCASWYSWVTRTTYVLSGLCEVI